METIEQRQERAQIVTAIGAMAAIALGGALVLLRGEIGVTNIALILALVVAVAAMSGGRLAGAVTGVAAAITYNFFHTQPYRSLRVDNAKDILTIVILGLAGVALGEVARRWEQSRVDVARSSGEVDRIVRVAELTVSGAPVSEVVARVESELVAAMNLAEARFDPGERAGATRPVLSHNGVVDEPLRTFVDGDFALPAEGVDLAVSFRSEPLGRLVLVPGPSPTGISRSQRRCAVVLADQLGCALAMASH